MTKWQTGLVAAVLALALLAAPNVRAQSGPLSPDNADETWAAWHVRCSFAFLCPFDTDVWTTFRNAMQRKPADQYMLAIYLITGDKIRRDEQGGQRWYGIAALEGYPRAAIALNQMRKSGAEMVVDEPAIAAAMKKLADANDPDAMRALSGMYLAGRGVDRDPGQAVALLRRAADAGSDDAEHDMAALMLGLDPNVPRNTGEALKWLERSGRHGNVEAMLQLGNILMDGLSGAQKQTTEGYRWVMRAAMLDDGRAQQKLSEVLAAGVDVEGRALWGPYNTAIPGLTPRPPSAPLIPVDLVEADKWFRVAARSPWYDNPAIRASIEPRMNSEQLQRARDAAAAWHKSTLAEALAADAVPTAAR